jgi:hypothetical protein
MRAATKKKVMIAKKMQAEVTFGGSLAVEQLVSLTAELQKLRHHPPLTRRESGRYEGDILGFVKGLRLSARVVYFLREYLSVTDLEVSWGHVLNEEEQSCSPECDIIIHSKGHIRNWNGGSNPIMNFKFVHAEAVRAVVSCKSQLDSIDSKYPKALMKFGIDQVFLFAESCRHDRLIALRAAAKKGGYSGLWCLYTTETGAEDPFIKADEAMYIEFGKAIRKAVK